MFNLSNTTRFGTLKVGWFFSDTVRHRNLKLGLNIHFTRLHKIVVDDVRIRTKIALGCLEYQTYPI